MRPGTRPSRASPPRRRSRSARRSCNPTCASSRARKVGPTSRRPRTRETFTASEGRGATRNAAAIGVGSVTKLTEAFAVASLAFGATKRKDSRFVALNSTCARLRVLGSAALEMCYVAMGTFDLFVHEALSPWDVAAPAFIAREAGASVLSLKTGEDAAWDERQVVIANPKLAREAMKLLRRP